MQSPEFKPQYCPTPKKVGPKMSCNFPLTVKQNSKKKTNKKLSQLFSSSFLVVLDFEIRAPHLPLAPYLLENLFS
jgi:hypothetical protein